MERGLQEFEITYDPLNLHVDLAPSAESVTGNHKNNKGTWEAAA